MEEIQPHKADWWWIQQKYVIMVDWMNDAGVWSLKDMRISDRWFLDAYLKFREYLDLFDNHFIGGG